MTFAEAMQALEAGKKVRRLRFPERYYRLDTSGKRCATEDVVVEGKIGGERFEWAAPPFGTHAKAAEDWEVV